ncbi:MAG: zinc-binding dehydrogenase [Candidatus Obscuribacterales bacterium]|nr:zinc-binding dehydrogenase [Candidatus Obscuribacterales bacterium]
MKVMRFHEFGEPSVLVLDEVPMPAAGKGQVLIKVKAAGVNFADTLQRRNLYPMPQALPVTPGFEVAGIVEQLGEGVKGLEKGSRVLALPTGGGYSEFAVADAAVVFPIPDDVSFEVAAALPGQALTVFYMLDEAQFKSGQTVAVTAAAGGVGAVAAQIAKLKGAAKVFGITGSAAKIAGLKATGYDAGFSADQSDWSDRLLEATGNAGVDIFLDSVGGDMFTDGLKVLNIGGTIVAFGRAAGKTNSLDPQSLMRKNQSVRGFSLYNYMSRPESLRSGLEYLMQACRDGKLTVSVTAHPLSEAVKVHTEMENRRTTGKIVLIP